jgi:hypothetical protein
MPIRTDNDFMPFVVDGTVIAAARFNQDGADRHVARIVLSHAFAWSSPVPS